MMKGLAAAAREFTTQVETFLKAVHIAVKSVDLVSSGWRNHRVEATVDSTSAPSPRVLCNFVLFMECDKALVAGVREWFERSEDDLSSSIHLSSF